MGMRELPDPRRRYGTAFKRGMAALPPSGEMTNYSPTFRERVTDYLRGAFFSDDKAGQMGAEKVSNFLESVTPYGVATGIDDVKGAVGEGDYKTAGMMLGMAFVPGPSLHHGSSRKGLSELRKSERGPLGPGVYTTTSPGLANRYGEEVYTLPGQYDVFTGAGHRNDNEWAGFKDDKARLSAAADSLDPSVAGTVKGYIDKMWSGDGYWLYQSIRNALGGDGPAQDLYKKAGFHGVSGQVDGPEYLLFDDVKMNQRGQY